MPATIDRNHAPSSVPAEMYEMALSTLETVNWGFDQADTLTRSVLDQARTVRHDSHKVVEKMVAQAKSNHEELQAMLETGMKNAMQFVPSWDALTGEDLRKQVSDLAERVSALSKK